MNDGITGHVFNHTYRGGDVFKIACLGDVHLGARATDINRFQRDMDIAKKIGARVIINGDLFDAIMFRDKRFSPTVLVEELQGKPAILNATVNYACDILEPYMDIIDEVGYGNHEATLRLYGSGDILEFTLDKLNANQGVNIEYGGYSGFITYRFTHEGGGSARTFIIYRKHGQGGNAPVTKGMIEFNRELEQLGNVDAVLLAHSHDKTSHVVPRWTTDQNGHPVFKEVHCLRTGAYFQHMKDTYAVERGMRPKPHGGGLLVLQIGGHGNKITATAHNKIMDVFK